MKTTKLKIKRTISAKVVATTDAVKIKFPKQVIGNVAIYFSNKEKEVMLQQFELVLNGDSLKAVKVN